MKRAIILADERSPRQVNGSGHVKALAKVAGLPLIVRNLRTLRSAGIEEAVVVTGYEAERINEALRSYHVGLPVTVVHNPNWHLGSAHSVLAAAGWIEDQCLLVPSDHLYPPSLARRIIFAAAPADSLVVAVDRRLDEIFDAEECIKARLDGETVVDVGMNLPSADAVCAGMIRITPHLVETLRRLLQDVEITLVDCVRAMARRRRVRALDVRNARWISISSPQARRYAELLLQIHGDTLETVDSPGHAVLLNPGPVTTTPRVKAAVGARDMCHREPVFSNLLDSVQRKLRSVFGATADHDILLVTASGTGGVESAITTFVPAGRTILVLRNGAFGERLAEIARTHGIEVAEVSVPWGDEIPIRDVERALAENPGIGAVAMVHHETSVGVLNDVGAVGALARAHGATLIVDTVSSMGAEDIDVERDKIDVCVTSANKCLHAFSGLASICVRRAVWATVENDRPRSYYLDLRRYRDYMDEHRQTPFTPAVNTMMSLNAALDELLEMTVEGRREHYARLSQRLRNGLRSLGLNLMLDPRRASHSVTMVEVPAGMSYHDIYQSLKDMGFIIYECKGAFAGRYFQVANMGALEEIHIDEFLGALGQVLARHREVSRPSAAGLRLA